jgi:hypothetical protein
MQSSHCCYKPHHYTICSMSGGLAQTRPGVRTVVNRLAMPRLSVCAPTPQQGNPRRHAGDASKGFLWAGVKIQAQGQGAKPANMRSGIPLRARCNRAPCPLQSEVIRQRRGRQAWNRSTTGLQMFTDSHYRQQLAALSAASSSHQVHKNGVEDGRQDNHAAKF